MVSAVLTHQRETRQQKIVLLSATLLFIRYDDYSMVLSRMPLAAFCLAVDHEIHFVLRLPVLKETSLF